MLIPWIIFQLKNLRFYILLSSALLSIAVVTFIKSSSNSSSLADIRIAEAFGLLAVLYLYLALLASPIAILFPKIPYKNKFIHARRAVGVSAFLFAILHGNTAFFSLLGGFEGINYLAPRYLFAVSLGSISTYILLAMAATSFDKAIKLLTAKWWKRIQRLIYLVVFAILIHALLLGSNYNNPNSPIPYVYNTLFSIVLISHALVIERRNEKLRRYHLPLILTTSIIFAIIIYYIYI